MKTIFIQKIISTSVDEFSEKGEFYDDPTMNKFGISNNTDCNDDLNNTHWDDGDGGWKLFRY